MNETHGQGRPEPSPGLAQVVGRALVDRRFRDQLSSDRDAALRDFALSPADREALDSIPPETLEEHARVFDEEAAAGITVSVVIKGTF